MFACWKRHMDVQQQDKWLVVCTICLYITKINHADIQQWKCVALHRCPGLFFPLLLNKQARRGRQPSSISLSMFCNQTGTNIQHTHYFRKSPILPFVDSLCWLDWKRYRTVLQLFSIPTQEHGKWGGLNDWDGFRLTLEKLAWKLRWSLCSFTMATGIHAHVQESIHNFIVVVFVCHYDKIWCLQ